MVFVEHCLRISFSLKLLVDNDDETKVEQISLNGKVVDVTIVNIPEHSSVLQGLVSMVAPVQALPPFLALIFTCLLLLWIPPPHEALHSVQPL